MRKKSQQLIEDMMKKRGYAYPSHKHLAEEDPEFLETYDKLYELVMFRRRVFPEKIKELFFLCAIAARNPGDPTAMRNHMKRALEKKRKSLRHLNVHSSPEEHSASSTASTC